MLTLLKL
nr:uORF3 [Colletotrichum gloeosporioides]